MRVNDAVLHGSGEKENEKVKEKEKMENFERKVITIGSKTLTPFKTLTLSMITITKIKICKRSLTIRKMDGRLEAQNNRYKKGIFNIRL